ncbi:hypothetical protein ACVGWI_00795, partial [Enterobacter hormaechei]
SEAGVARGRPRSGFLGGGCWACCFGCLHAHPGRAVFGGRATDKITLCLFLKKLPIKPKISF